MKKREKEYTKAFRQKIRDRGWIFKQSTREEDMHDHVDCHVFVKDMGRVVRHMKIELKGRKYNCRANEGKREHRCQYIEFLNVNGDKGWLFGEADYIAIEGDSKFYLIERKAMITFCEDLFGVDLKQSLKNIEKDLSKHVWSTQPALHKLYRRRNRKDLVTQISMSDVRILSKFTL